MVLCSENISGGPLISAGPLIPAPGITVLLYFKKILKTTGY